MSEAKQPPQQQEHQPGREHAMSPQPEFRPRYPGVGKLRDKVALITGGDSGIGRAVAVAMAREGAEIAFVYLDEDRDAQDTLAILKDEEGVEAVAIRGDIGDESFCREAVQRTVEELGRLDILINHAGEQHVESDFRQLDAAQLERTFRTNVYGYFFMTKWALDHLDRGSTIINTTSITAYKGYKSMVDYAATRGAIVSFTRSMALALVDEGIRVNGVAPGPIWTPLIPASFEAEKVAKHGGSAPMERVGQPNEVASCYVFLASEEASYMTGQILHPNGGTIVGS